MLLVKILLLPVLAPIWIILGFVIGYIRDMFLSFTDFVARTIGAPIMVPLMAFFTISVFFDHYFDPYSSFGDFMSDCRVGEPTKIKWITVNQALGRRR